MHIDFNPKLDFSDVLLRPKRSTLGSRSEVTLERTYNFVNSRQIFHGIPIIASNMDTVGTLDMANEMNNNKMMCAIHKHYDVSDLADFFRECSHMSYKTNFYSMGIVEKDVKKFKEFMMWTNAKWGGFQIPYVCIDVANGYSERFIDFVKMFREQNSSTVIMAGNVVTPEVTEQLILAGADIVKVGIGSGSVCTTRKMTGVGYPQLSSTMECADAAHGLGGHICSDGGCTVPGDVAKAFSAGADFVMLGGMLSGHDECGGEIVDVLGERWNASNDKQYMKYYGMSSEEAHNKHSGGVASYRAAEGKSVLVPYKGKVENTIREILGGLRSACTYVGAKTLKELPKRATFVIVNRQLNTVFGE